jgi:hypothetical protein
MSKCNVRVCLSNDNGHCRLETPTIEVHKVGNKNYPMCADYYVDLSNI